MGFVPVALAFMTLGIVAILVWANFFKTKSELPDDENAIRSQDKLRTKTTMSTYERTPQSSADHGTPPRQ